ncbi:MAG: hypothetical protein ACOY46_14725 [Bacillota bacterium]
MTDIKRIYSLLLAMGIFFSVLTSYNTQLLFSMDNDTFWHVKTGEYIYTHREIPSADVFSWYGAENNFKWINHEWLYDLLIFAVHSIYGLKGVAIFTSIIAGLVFLLLYILMEIRSRNTFLSLFLACIAIAGMVNFLSPRPQTISYCLLLLMAIALEKKKWPGVLPIIIIGVNVHGGFYPMYILLLTYYLWREKPWLVLVSPLLVMLNPYGWEIITYPFRVQMYPEFTKYIMEWTATKLTGQGHEYNLITYIVLFLLIFNKKIKKEDALFSLFIIVQTFMAARHITFLYLLVIPVLTPYIAQNNIFTDLKEAFEKKLKYVYVVTLLVLLSLAVYDTDFNKPVNTSNFPDKKVIIFIKENNLKRIYNMYDDGGFLIYNDIKPMIDGRADIFAPIYNDTNLFKDYFEADLLMKDYKKFLDNYMINYVIINKNRPIYQAMQHSVFFKNIYEDDLYVIVQYIN